MKSELQRQNDAIKNFSALVGTADSESTIDLANRIRSGAEAAKAIAPRLSVKSIEDITNTEYPPLKFIAQDIICEGTTVLAGASKSGKSWMALYLCMAVASGTSFLDRQTEKGQVLYLALEDSERSIKSRSQKLSIKTGIELDDMAGNLDIVTRAPTVKEGLLPMLETWVKEHPHARLIVIDVMQKIRGITPGNRNMYQDDYSFLTQFTDFAKDHGIGVLLLHHLNRRDNKSVGDPFDKISGSNGIMATVDTALILERKRGQTQATLMYDTRAFRGDNIVVNFDDCLWSVISNQASEYNAKQAYDRNPVVRLVKALATERPGHFLSYVDLMKESKTRFGDYVAGSTREMTAALRQVTEDLFLYDDIVVELFRRSDQRGIRLLKAVTQSDAVQTEM